MESTANLRCLETRVITSACGAGEEGREGEAGPACHFRRKHERPCAHRCGLGRRPREEQVELDLHRAHETRRRAGNPACHRTVIGTIPIVFGAAETNCRGSTEASSRRSAVIEAEAWALRRTRTNGANAGHPVQRPDDGRQKNFCKLDCDSLKPTSGARAYVSSKKNGRGVAFITERAYQFASPALMRGHRVRSGGRTRAGGVHRRDRLETGALGLRTRPSVPGLTPRHHGGLRVAMRPVSRFSGLRRQCSEKGTRLSHPPALHITFSDVCVKNMHGRGEKGQRCT